MQAGSLTWFGVHEIRLAWRDWMSMMTAGQRRSERFAYVGIAVLALGFLALAYGLLAGPLAEGVTADTPTFVLMSGLYALAFSLMVPQAIESVTRAFYARADLDLLLSSPVSERTLFTVRVLAIVVQTSALALFLILPFMAVAVMIDGLRWLAVLPSVFALAAIATSLALLVTFLLFNLIGPRRTRLVAQIVAAVTGACFLIGTQIAAIMMFGEMSRVKLFQSEEVLRIMPGVDSVVWLPARALLGEPVALLTTTAASALLLTVVIFAFAGRFGRTVLIAADVGEGAVKARTPGRFKCRTPKQALRQKEWRLLKRDPWLVSQTLMQVFYLLPPAILLWRNYSAETVATVIITPVLVMAVGQLAGGLSWIAISGEDAHELVETAPVSARIRTVAKIEAVLAAIAVAAAPLVLAIGIVHPWVGLVCVVSIACASASAVCIQLMFRSHARRSQFRRRQTASKVSTFAEAFSSISWAGFSVMAAAQSLWALIFLVAAGGVLLVAYCLSPRRA